jgi:hypothetical protein
MSMFCTASRMQFCYVIGEPVMVGFDLLRHG